MSAKAQCVILGGGGHARVVIDCLRFSCTAAPACILDANPELWGRSVDGVEVRGGDENLSSLRAGGILRFTVGLGMGRRERLFAAGLSAGLTAETIVHPSAIIAASARLGEGNQVFAAAVINPGAILGTNVLVNTGAIIEHDCVLAAHVNVASGACLAGGVIVEEGAFIGAGSTVRQGLRIGAWAVVGAGAVVVKDVAAGTTVVGVPAHEMR